jgi:hypothetical protein
VVSEAIAKIPDLVRVKQGAKVESC